MNEAIGQRFHQFIKKYIGSMQLAADALDTSIRHISEACNGITDVTVKDLYFLMKDYKLNPDWLLFGKGSEIKGMQDNKNLLTDISAIQLKLDVVEAKIKLQDKLIKELFNKLKHA